jgi:hypothetical protein
MFQTELSVGRPRGNGLEASVTVRFLADEDLDADIIDGLLAREPAIESLLLVWSASQADEWRNRVEYLPFR